jgi:hypothetical protein
MIKPLKNRNKEIIIQYLTDSSVLKDEPPVVRLVGVSMDVRLDVKQMSKIAQDGPSVLIGKRLSVVLVCYLRLDNVCCIWRISEVSVYFLKTKCTATAPKLMQIAANSM